MSDSERPDIAAADELEQLIRALGEEMAAWRRRAHEAESRIRDLEAARAPAGGEPAQADSDLRRENRELRQRLEAARARTQQLVERLRFLRQQHQIGAER